MKERGEGEKRWHHGFEWIDPRAAQLEGELLEGELHWQRITPEAARQAFQVMERFQGIVDLSTLSEGGFVRERDRLAALRDGGGQPRFNEDDLHWFDTFFGKERIKVDALENSFDVTNGRHRLWMAQQCGVRILPAFVARQPNTSGNISGNKGKCNYGDNGGTMGMELREVEEAAEQQENRAGELKEEVEAHQQRVEQLDVAVKELQSVMQKLDSDESRQALDSMQNAKQETEKLLDEKRQEHQKLLDENERMGQENTEAYREAQQALQKVEAIAQIAGGDEGGLSGHLSEMQASLKQDVEHRLDTDRALLQARQRLQLVF